MQLKNKILLIYLICFLGFGVNTYAQSFGSNLNTDNETENEVGFQANESFKPDVKVTLGSSFTSFGPGQSTFGTFIAPEISMPVAKKFDISVGMAYTSLFHSGYGESSFGGTNSQYGSIYISGTYHINEKFSVRGTGYKTFLLNPSNFSENNANNYLDFSNQGVILDLEYRVTDNFRINASFEYREQNYPDYYFGNPYNQFGSPMRSASRFGGIGGMSPGF